jgi:HPt (histidine-containing phosphotransfer) domain-containing protein
MTAGGDVLAQLRPNYLARLKSRIVHLRATADALDGGGLEPQERDELHRAAHSMASSAAIFGHGGLSAAARAVEQIFETPAVGWNEQCASLRRLLEEAERVTADN